MGITPMRTIWMAPLLVLLAACSGKSDREQRPPAPDVAANFSGPLDARGTDPAWGLTVRGTTLSLTRPNQADMTLTAPGAVISAHQASWTAKTSDGRSLTATFYASACSAPASSAAYPFTVEVDLPGQAPLSGCGGPPAKR
jgi:uncharacterized membrane protein